MPEVPEKKFSAGINSQIIICREEIPLYQGTRQVDIDIMQYANKYYVVTPQDTVLKFAEITRVKNGRTTYY